MGLIQDEVRASRVHEAPRSSPLPRNVLGTVSGEDGGMKAHTAARLGWSLWGVSVVFIVLPFLIPSLLVGLWFGTISGVGGLIASRRSMNPIGWIMIAIGVLLAIGILARDYATYALLDHPNSVPFGDVTAWLSTWVPIPGLALLAFLVMLFPDGRLPSPHWRPYAWATAVAITITTVLNATAWGPMEGFGGVRNPVGIGISFGSGSAEWLLLLASSFVIAACGVAAVASQLVRLRRATRHERQQVKWFWYSAALTVTAFILGGLPFFGVGVYLALLGLTGMPIAIGIAILAHRLYDIDLIIHRTLVYGALTATLALVYVGGVAGGGSLLGEVTGEEGNNLVVVASTLAVAAMFRPARARIQAFIDRRFYRSKYDAAKALDSFSLRLRDEVSLDTVSTDLLAVVNETMQPAHASLWLRERPPERT
jgi:hypothetical protein